MRPTVNRTSSRRSTLVHARAAALPLALLAALPGGAQPLRVDYVVGAWAMHTDNIDLSEDAARSETVRSPEIAFSAAQSSSSTRFLAQGRMQYLDFREGTYGNEWRSEFAGQFTWMAIPQRLSFVVEDHLGRRPIDFDAGYSPGNQQQVNVFSAGPTLFSRFGEAMRGQVDLRYSNTRAEETREFDSDRVFGAGRLFRDLGPDQWISLNVDAGRVRFDLAGDQADYDRQDAYLRYRREAPRLTLDASAGYSRLEQEGAGGKASSPLGRLQVDWQVAPRSVLAATAAYQFADTASDLVGDTLRLDTLTLGEFQPPTGMVDPAVYLERRYELAYRFQGDRWTFDVNPYASRIDYERPGLVGWTLSGAYATARVQLRPQLDLAFSAMRADRDYLDGAREDRDTALGVSLGWQINRHLVASLGWQRLDRDSSLPGQDYRADSVTAGISYRR